MPKKFKVIQVNIYKGKFLDALVDFLKKEKPDIVCMQEVTVGQFNYCDDKSVNLFELLKKELGLNGAYNGDLKLTDLPDAMLGNAVFTKFEVVDQKVTTIKELGALTYDQVEHGDPWQIFPQIPRHLLDLTLNMDGIKMHAISVHGIWTAPPADNEDTLKQAKIIADHLRFLKDPFIMGGDFNAVPESQTVKIVGKVAVNLMEGSGVLQTTHPKIHKIAPRGYLIDYIFTSRHFKLRSLKVPEVTVSDHLPVVAELEVLS